MLQFLLGPSDRRTAEAVRCRIDVKYAVAMELDGPGFRAQCADRPPRSFPPTTPRPVTPGAGQNGLAQPLSDLIAHRGPADRGPVHQEPVPSLPGSCPVHQHRRQRPHRRLLSPPAARAP
ncbi:hypothetical protein PUR49_06895 [Streptomyces sp. BE147]|nr:hypothetical protein [Streptomyces sp. BE147]